MNWEDYKDHSTSDLLEHIKWKNDSDTECSTSAVYAYRALFFRFREDVVKKCRIISKNWGYDNDTGDSIAEATFARFWQYPFSFNQEKCNTPNIDTCLKLYLYVIAKRLLSTYKDGLESDANPYDGNEQIVIDFPDLDNMDVSTERKKGIKSMYDKINNILNGLSPKHKIIYLTYKQHGKDGFTLPRNLSKQLREELELTQSSIRVYKKEAFDSVDKLLNIYGNK